MRHWSAALPAKIRCHDLRRRRGPAPVPDPVRDHRRPADPLSRQRRVGADAARGDRRGAQLRDDQPRQRAARRPSARRTGDRAVRDRARRCGEVPGRTADGDRLHRRLHGCDQPRGLFLRPAAETRRPHPAVRAGAPFEHRAVAAPAAEERRRARHDPGHGGRPDRPRPAAQAGDAEDQADLSCARLQRHRRAHRRAQGRRGGEVGRRQGDARRRPARAARPNRPQRARHRFLRLRRPQGLRPQRRRRAVGQAGIAGGDAAVPRAAAR